jgi:hypothetical protein
VFQTQQTASFHNDLTQPAFCRPSSHEVSQSGQSAHRSYHPPTQPNPTRITARAPPRVRHDYRADPTRARLRVSDPSSAGWPLGMPGPYAVRLHRSRTSTHSVRDDGVGVGGLGVAHLPCPRCSRCPVSHSVKQEAQEGHGFHTTRHTWQADPNQNMISKENQSG